MSFRNLRVDVWRLVMAACVVELHADGVAAFGPDALAGFNVSLAHMGVPFFFAVSGLFFAPPQGSAAPWSAARRYLLMYGVWTLLYLPVIVFQARWAPSPAGSVAKDLATGYLHLWYLLHLGPTLLLCGWLEQRWPQRLLPVAVGLYLAGWLLQSAGLMGWLDGSPLRATQATRNFIFYGAPFFLLGRWAAEAPLWSAPRLWALTGLAVLLLGVETFGHLALGTHGPSLNLVLGDMPAVLALLLWARQATQASAARWPSDVATAIYLLHPWALFLLRVLGVKHSLLLWGLGTLLAAAATPLLVRAAGRWPALLGGARRSAAPATGRVVQG